MAGRDHRCKPAADSWSAHYDTARRVPDKLPCHHASHTSYHSLVVPCPVLPVCQALNTQQHTQPPTCREEGAIAQPQPTSPWVKFDEEGRVYGPEGEKQVGGQGDRAGSAFCAPVSWQNLHAQCMPLLIKQHSLNSGACFTTGT